MYLANLSLPGFIGNTEIFDNINVPFHKVDDDGVLTGRKRVEAALKREGGLSMGTSRGGTGGPAMSSLLTQGPCYRP